MPDNEKPFSENDLAGFIGTTQWYRHPMFTGCLYTEGVQYLAEHAKCYWLLEAIFTHQLDPKAKAEPFQLWTLTVSGSRVGTLTMTDGNSDRAKIRQVIEYTDFPLQTFALYFVDGVLMLRSEY